MARGGEEQSDIEDFLDAVRKIRGQDFIDALLLKLGGARIYVPKLCFDREGTLLVEFLGGVELANQFLSELRPHFSGGGHIAVPMGKDTFVINRAVIVQDALLAGEMSVAQIARKYRISERSVYAHRRSLVDCGLLFKKSRRG